MASYESTRDRPVVVERMQAMGLRNDSKGYILIVEDWEPNIVVLSLMLEMCNYAFDIAHDGVEALKLFEGHAYDAVLMDVGLPDMTGYQITRQMRRYEVEKRRAATPIIATTAYAMKGDREKCLESGMTDYLSKPIDFAALDLLLRQYIGNTRH